MVGFMQNRYYSQEYVVGLKLKEFRLNCIALRVM